MKYKILLISMFGFLSVSAQFDPAGGEAGSKAVHFQSDLIQSWAQNVRIERGWMNKADTSLGLVSFGMEEDAIGTADGKFVSLGDGGFAEIKLTEPMQNRMGYEFAVFENGFKYPGGYYLELATVSVSTDGVHFTDFPAISLSDTAVQVDNGGVLSPVKLDQLAGKHPANWGTPFDLDDLPDAEFLKRDSILYIRITDVTGSLNADYGTRDSKGSLINDPWPTPFPSGGFDLDAIAFLKEGYTHISSLHHSLRLPNPMRPSQPIRLPVDGFVKATWMDVAGRSSESSIHDDLLSAPNIPGIYTLVLETATTPYIQRICVY
jgi:hypothetical protein